MSLNYDFIDTIKLIPYLFKSSAFISILISVIVLGIIFEINKNSKTIKYVFLIINLFLVVLILINYLNKFLEFNYSNLISNIYFYFLNSIIYLILITYISFKNEYRRIDYTFYYLSLIGLLYSIFMTFYLKNITLIVIGNIFPIIKFGNYIYLIYYIYITFNLILKRKRS